MAREWEAVASFLEKALAVPDDGGRRAFALAEWEAQSRRDAMRLASTRAATLHEAIERWVAV